MVPRGLPCQNGFNLLRVHKDALRRHNMPKKLNRAQVKVALFQLGIEAMVS